MQEIYKDYLFEKHILVSEGTVEETNVFESLFAMAHFFGVKITHGKTLVHREMLRELSKRLGENVPEPFYKGFPQSVRALSTEDLLFDQLRHYITTYGLGNFDAPGHSVFEQDFERAAFRENTTPLELTLQSEQEAQGTIHEIVADLLVGTRPLSERQYALCLSFVLDQDGQIPEIASKNTLIRLLIDTKNIVLADRLQLSDMMKAVDELNYRSYGSDCGFPKNLRIASARYILRRR